MVFGSGRRIEVETYDASTLGLGLVAPIGLADFEDDVDVTLEPVDQGFRLSGEIVFAIGHRPGESRVGVELTRSSEIGKYHELLGEADDGPSTPSAR